jgi:hypothetical protein
MGYVFLLYCACVSEEWWIGGVLGGIMDGANVCENYVGSGNSVIRHGRIRRHEVIRAKGCPKG